MLKQQECSPQKNHLLNALTEDVQNRLFPHLQLIPLLARSILCESNQKMNYVYFPISSVISLQYLLLEGRSTAFSTVGNGGLVGFNLFMGMDTINFRSMVQLPGFAYRAPKLKIEEEFDRQGELMKLVMYYTQYQISLTSQTVACNRHHSVLQQLCRWLLTSIECLGDDNLVITQEFISNMLGVRREGVTAAASLLRQQGIITYHRGIIKVIDRSKLESLCCECYGVLKKESNKLLKYLPQNNIIENTKAIPTARLAM